MGASRQSAFVQCSSAATPIPCGWAMRKRAAALGRRFRFLLLVAAGLSCWEQFGGCAARAQVVQQGAGDGSGRSAINLGGRGWGGSDGAQATPSADRDAEKVQVSAKAGIASDYIYRGVTLSDRKPAVGGGVEATYGLLYGGMTAASVRLPTQPSGEITFSGGVRPKLGNIDFDLGVTYFLYPGEMPNPTNGIEYWEGALRAVAPIGESIRVAGGYAYSPNVSNTGAWSQYVAAGLGYELPSRLLPKDFGIAFTGAAGYSWFGTQAPALGGFALPSYLNWQAGTTFTYKSLNLDLRYYGTNMSKENCYVFTGDPNAQPGGRVNPITNPDGLVSRWCSTAIVGKFWFAFN